MPNGKLASFDYLQFLLKSRFFSLCNAVPEIMAFFQHLDPGSSTEVVPTFLVKDIFLFI